MMLKTMRKHGVTLALFAAGSTGLTAAINELTKSTIDQQAALQQTSSALLRNTLFLYVFILTPPVIFVKILLFYHSSIFVSIIFYINFLILF